MDHILQQIVNHLINRIAHVTKCNTLFPVFIIYSFHVHKSYLLKNDEAS